MKKILLSLFLLGLIDVLFAQENIKITGKIVDVNTKYPIFGANIATKDALYGTASNIDGEFTLELPTSYHEVLISYIGYQQQEISININEKNISVELQTAVMEEVEVNRNKLDRSYINTYNTQTLDAKELTKAACCNLSESFETNAAIDVSYSDAVSGAKKMRMLGLDGHYTQIMFENMPGIRGLENSFGMLFIPGPFMHSIAINKGAGSVINGYEALTGQINIQYKEPYESERFFVNLFASRHGQFELNTNVSHRFNDKWSTIALAHGMLYQFKQDMNHDGFQDMPMNQRVVATNKWHYDSGKNFESQFGINYTYDQREAGQFDNFHANEGLNRLYQTKNINKRYDAFAKTGFLFNNKLQSIGVQYRYYNHQQLAWYGSRYYNGLENYANINFIFQTAMSKPHNMMKLGASYVFNKFDETLNDLYLGRTESVPGLFAEYTYQDENKLSFVGGLRADFSNLFGVWLSPKANFKYIMPKDFTLKLSVGKGYRTANLLAENMQAMASSRVYDVQNYNYESAWNYGGNLMKEFYLGFQPASIVVDFYRTDFQHRMIADYETFGQLNFYALQGKSYANSFQVETKVEAAEGLDLQLAYKFDDVKIEYNDGLKLAPYIPRHKLLITADYELPKKTWRFNVTGQLFGKSRLPSTQNNPVNYQRPDYSKIFFKLNSQITAVVKKDWEFYLGAENMLNVWQKKPIIASDDAFGKYFDASMIWGPLGGVRIYGGLRFTLPYKNVKKSN